MSQRHLPSPKASELAVRSALVLVGLLWFVQVALFVWMAPRGFEFTDEAYYFLQYLHWRDLTATATFFGAVFELPFRLMGQSIWGVRLLGLSMLLVGSSYLAYEASVHTFDRGAGWVPTDLLFLLSAMTGGMMYYGYLATLRAPSYNLLALVSAMVATGLLLRLVRGAIRSPARRSLAFLYGLTLSVCALGKPTSGVLLTLIHITFLFSVNRIWMRQQVLPLLLFAGLGGGLALGALQLAHPQWLDVVRESLVMGAATEGRNLHGLARSFFWELQGLPWALGLGLGVACAFVVLLGHGADPPSNGLLSIGIVALLAFCLAWIIVDWQTTVWLLMLGAATLAINAAAPRSMRRTSTLLMLLAAPPALSFGTNMPVLGHSQLNAAFAWVALAVALRLLHTSGRLGTLPLVTCLFLLCVPGAAIQLQAAFDVHRTYRLLGPLTHQDVPTWLGSELSTLKVDPETAASVRAMSEAARTAGWKPGMGLLDFTGDSPGWVFALGGRPMGVPWLLGGYPGSQAAAERLLSQLHELPLRQTWLLSSSMGARRIVDWQKLLSSRIGPDSHELIATINVPVTYQWNERQPQRRTDIQLWRPKPTATQ